MVLSSWPLFGLTITTPRLTLRYIDDELADELMQLAATDGIHDADFMPFSVPWTRFEPPFLQQQGVQHYWRTRAETSTARWALPFATIVEGAVVGTQSLMGEAFAVRRWVETGSWLGRSHQGKGIGKEMRAAVLHLAFDALGASYAGTSAFADNPASIGVTRSLGYVDNGWRIDDREGKPVRHLRFVLERSSWEPRRRDDIVVEGFDDDCRAMLGL